MQTSGCVLVYKCPKAKAGSGRPADSRGEDADSAGFLKISFIYYLFIFSCAGPSPLRRLFSVAGGAPLESRCCGSPSAAAERGPRGVPAPTAAARALSSGFRAPERKLNGCAACSTAHAISLEPGIEPMSPALAGRVLSAEPPQVLTLPFKGRFKASQAGAQVCGRGGRNRGRVYNPPQE